MTQKQDIIVAYNHLVNAETALIICSKINKHNLNVALFEIRVAKRLLQQQFPIVRIR
jgi:hypothetical protein